MIHYAAKGMNEQKYIEILRRLEQASPGGPPGRLHHASYGPRDSLLVVDVFDTMKNFEAFGGTLVPILKSLGVEATPEIHEVHNLVRGG